jgi:hypothetical protein
MIMLLNGIPFMMPVVIRMFTLCPAIYQISGFVDLLTPSVFDDEGIQCVLKDGYFVIPMRNICEYYGINIKEIFDEYKEEN